MKKLLALLTIFSLLAFFTQKKNECEERTMPYWANGINSRIAGENPILRSAFKEIQISKTNISPSKGFITLRMNISKTGRLCDVETFQIDKNYENTEFDDGALIKELKGIAVGLTNWKLDKHHKTYNLIRLKIKNGKIEEIF